MRRFLDLVIPVVAMGSLEAHLRPSVVDMIFLVSATSAASEFAYLEIFRRLLFDGTIIAPRVSLGGECNDIVRDYKLIIIFVNIFFHFLNYCNIFIGHDSSFFAVSPQSKQPLQSPKV